MTLEDMIADVASIEGAEITHLVIDHAVWAGIRAHRPPVEWKPRSIRARRRNRGRMVRAMRLAEMRTRA